MPLATVAHSFDQHIEGKRRDRITSLDMQVTLEMAYNNTITHGVRMFWEDVSDHQPHTTWK